MAFARSLQRSVSTRLDQFLELFQTKRAQNILLVSILVLAVFLRFWKIEYTPMADDADELAYIYAGQSLLEYGEPISWSSFDYKENTWETLVYDSGTTNKVTTQTFVKPWFDHPMLLPLVTGGLSRAAGYDFPSVPPALLFRLPMLLLSLGTLYFLYALARLFFGYWPALFSLALVAGSPAFIIIQRMVVGENVVVFCLLLAMYLYLVQRRLFWAGVVAVVAVQAKVVGLIIAPIISFVLVLENQWKKAILFSAIAGAVAVALFAGSGYHLAGDNFFQALQNQSYRLLGWSNPVSVFSKPGFQNYDMYDFSYYVILILGITGAFLSRKVAGKVGRLTHLWPGVILLLLSLIWVTSAELTSLGWYKIPLFIVLAVAAAGWIAERKFLLPIIFMGITLVTNLGLVRYPTHPFPSTETLRLTVIVLLAVLFSTLLWLKKPRYQAALLGALMALYLAQATYVNHYYFIARCTDRSECTVPTVTFSGWVRKMLR